MYLIDRKRNNEKDIHEMHEWLEFLLYPKQHRDAWPFIRWYLEIKNEQLMDRVKVSVPKKIPKERVKEFLQTELDKLGYKCIVVYSESDEENHMYVLNTHGLDAVFMLGSLVHGLISREINRPPRWAPIMSSAIEIIGSLCLLDVIWVLTHYHIGLKIGLSSLLFLSSMISFYKIFKKEKVWRP